MRTTSTILTSHTSTYSTLSWIITQINFHHHRHIWWLYISRVQFLHSLHYSKKIKVHQCSTPIDWFWNWNKKLLQVQTFRLYLLKLKILAEFTEEEKFEKFRLFLKSLQDKCKFVDWFPLGPVFHICLLFLHINLLNFKNLFFGKSLFFGVW